jgi:hypothetical protein
MLLGRTIVRAGFTTPASSKKAKVFIAPPPLTGWSARPLQSTRSNEQTVIADHFWQFDGIECALSNESSVNRVICGVPPPVKPLVKGYAAPVSYR